MPVYKQVYTEYMHVSTYMCIHICTHRECAYVYICVCTHKIHVYTQDIYIYAFMYTLVHTEHIHTCICIYIPKNICINIHTGVYPKNICIYIQVLCLGGYTRALDSPVTCVLDLTPGAHSACSEWLRLGGWLSPLAEAVLRRSVNESLLSGTQRWPSVSAPISSSKEQRWTG